MFERIINLLFPPKCIFCGKILEISNSIEICHNCFENIPFISDGGILRNGSSFCDEVICVSEYSGIVRTALKKYKFNGKSCYCRAFSKLLSEKVKKVTKCRIFDIIISVPLHKSRETTRGYNQALLISKIVSRETGIRESSYLLTRTRDTGSQSLIRTKNGRQNNIKNAFRVTFPEKVAGKTVLIVDDILTTGFTVDECSRVLKEAGAKRVVAAVIASGRKY